MSEGVFLKFYIFVQSNSLVALRVNFFFPKIKGYFLFFIYLGFLQLSLGVKGVMVFFKTIKKNSLRMQYTILYTVGWCMLAARARSSSNDNFSPPPVFSLLHLKMCVGFAKLQNDPRFVNCIEFDLVFFNFISCIWFFMFFLSYLLLIFLFLFIFLLIFL